MVLGTSVVMTFNIFHQCKLNTSWSSILCRQQGTPTALRTGSASDNLNLHWRLLGTPPHCFHLLFEHCPVFPPMASHGLLGLHFLFNSARLHGSLLWPPLCHPAPFSRFLSPLCIPGSSWWIPWLSFPPAWQTISVASRASLLCWTPGLRSFNGRHHKTVTLSGIFFFYLTSRIWGLAKWTYFFSVGIFTTQVHISSFVLLFHSFCLYPLLALSFPGTKGIRSLNSPETIISFLFPIYFQRLRSLADGILYSSSLRFSSAAWSPLLSLPPLCKPRWVSPLSFTCFLSLLLQGHLSSSSGLLPE